MLRQINRFTLVFNNFSECSYYVVLAISKGLVLSFILIIWFLNSLKINKSKELVKL